MSGQWCVSMEVMKTLLKSTTNFREKIMCSPWFYQLRSDCFERDKNIKTHREIDVEERTTKDDDNGFHHVAIWAEKICTLTSIVVVLSSAPSSCRVYSNARFSIRRPALFSQSPILGHHIFLPLLESTKTDANPALTPNSFATIGARSDGFVSS